MNANEKKVQVGVVYTSTTEELIADVNREIAAQIGGDVVVKNYQDPDILAEVRQNGHVTTAPAAKLVSMFMQAALDGADAILNVCSSVGEVADAAEEIGKYIGVPIVRIDKEMCCAAVRAGSRIGVLATLPTTLTPTKNTLKYVAREANKDIVLVDGLIDGAFGIDQDQFKKMLSDKAKEIADQVDVIVLCQGSMAYAEDAVSAASGHPVFSSPKFGAAALKEALAHKGCLRQ